MKITNYLMQYSDSRSEGGGRIHSGLINIDNLSRIEEPHRNGTERIETNRRIAGMMIYNNRAAAAIRTLR